MLRLLYVTTIGNHEPDVQLRLANAVMIVAGGDGGQQAVESRWR
jgi:hypothetical protein